MRIGGEAAATVVVSLPLAAAHLCLLTNYASHKQSQSRRYLVTKLHGNHDGVDKDETKKTNRE